MSYILNHSNLTFGSTELIALIATVALIAAAVILLKIQSNKTEALKNKVAEQSAERVMYVRDTVELQQQNL